MSQMNISIVPQSNRCTQLRCIQTWACSHSTWHTCTDDAPTYTDQQTVTN